MPMLPGLTTVRSLPNRGQRTVQLIYVNHSTMIRLTVPFVRPVSG